MNSTSNQNQDIDELKKERDQQLILNPSLAALVKDEILKLTKDISTILQEQLNSKDCLIQTLIEKNTTLTCQLEEAKRELDNGLACCVKANESM